MTITTNKGNFRKHHRIKTKLTSYLLSQIDDWYLRYPGVKPFISIKLFPDKYVNHDGFELYCIDETPVSEYLRVIEEKTVTKTRKQYPRNPKNNGSNQFRPRTITEDFIVMEEDINTETKSLNLVATCEKDVQLHCEMTDRPELETVFQISSINHQITEKAINKSRKLTSLNDLINNSETFLNSSLFETKDAQLKMNSEMIFESVPIQLLYKSDDNIKYDLDALHNKILTQSDIIDELMDDVLEKDKVIDSLIASHKLKNADIDDLSDTIEQLHERIGSIEAEINNLKNSAKHSGNNLKSMNKGHYIKGVKKYKPVNNLWFNDDDDWSND